MKTRISFTATSQSERDLVKQLLDISDRGNKHKEVLEELDVWLKYSAKADGMHTAQEVRDKLWEMLKNENIALFDEV